MNGFRQAGEDYISMRRALGFKFALQGRLVIELSLPGGRGATRLTAAARWVGRQASGADPAGGTSACQWHEVLPIRAQPQPGHQCHHDVAVGTIPPTDPYLLPADIDALMTATAVLRHPLRRAYGP
jgi:hypothetical protein